MVFATAGDIIIMWTVYLMMALVHRSFTWFQEGWNWIVKFSLVGFSVLIAIVVELWAIKTERWAYTVNNPIVPFLDVSILPLMQMALINPISMFGSKIILTSLAKAKLHTKENI